MAPLEYHLRFPNPHVCKRVHLPKVFSYLLFVGMGLSFLLQIFHEIFYTILRNLPFMMKPKSKNYLIIGASTGIGRSIVVQLARKTQSPIGIAVASRKIDELEELKKDVEEKYPNVKVFVRKFDITHINDAESLIDDANRSLGPIDTIVVNAGISDIHKLGDEDYFKKAKAILDTNLMGPVSCISAFVKYAKKMGIINPYIVTVSSIASSRALPNLTAYGTSKRGLDFFIEGVHNELYLDGFWTTNIRPGLITTQMNDWIDGASYGISSANAAKIIVRAMERRKKNVIVPFFWAFALPILHMIPTFLLRRFGEVKFDPAKYEVFKKHTYNKSS